jgi:predicted dehydrogenase
MASKRYAVVGVGNRGSGMFVLPMVRDFAKTAKLVAVCDSNPVRAAYCVSRLPAPVPAYTDFARMLRETNPDGIIVATRDCTHEQYVIAGLRAGKRVYSEKPLCTTAAQCRAILAAARRSRGQCFVTHNMRYSAAMQRVREVIRSGAIGRVTLMRFDETLDRCHGADYFRRWHRRLANTGGLLIHKASHHFDILNWWADSIPATVRAQGRLAVYGRNGAFRGKRCRGCAHAKKCPFYVDMFQNEIYRNMFLAAEHADGYLRDGCVFDREVDICDQMQVLLGYANGIQVSYTLNAFCPYESMRCVVEGTGGRLEYGTVYNTGWAAGKQRVPGLEEHAGESLRLFLPGKKIQDVAIERREGGHGGADPGLRAEFFGDWKKKPSDRMASLDEAVQAVMIGAAANEAIRTGRTVDVQKFLKG